GFVAIALGYVFGLAASIPARTFDPFNVLTASFPLVGIVILLRQPRNTIGWILLAIGAVGAIGAPLSSYGGYGLRTHPTLPGAGVAAVASLALWVPFIGIPGIYLLLLFPDGRPPSPRWRAVAWLGAIAMAGAYAGLVVFPGPLGENGLPNVPNPLALDALRGREWIVFLFMSLIPISILAAAASLVLRFRRS